MTQLRKNHSEAIKFLPRDNVDFRMACDKIVVHLGITQLGYALDRFGIGKDVKIFPEDCQRFCDVADAMVLLNHDYSQAFRWLLWHPESDALYESTDPVQTLKDLESGQVSDVTGVEQFEARFFKLH